MLSFRKRAEVYDEFCFGQGVGVHDKRTGNYEEEWEFMKMSGNSCTKGFCRVRFPDKQWCMLTNVSSDYLRHETSKCPRYARIALLGWLVRLNHQT